MDVIKLKPNADGVGFFSDIFLARDHNSSNRTYYDLFQTLTLWTARCYHVYVVLDNNKPIGVCHGSYTEGDFYGHCYFFSESRGKSAIRGIKLTMETIEKDMDVDRFFARINEDNRLAQVAVCSIGYKRVSKDTFMMEVRDGDSR
jgi:hypothetical protein